MQENQSNLSSMELGPLGGLPESARFIPVVNKRPIATNWNGNPEVWLSAESVLKETASNSTYTGFGLMTGSQVGQLCWLDFDGEEVSATGEIVRSASIDFETLFSRPVSDLPPAPLNTSGRPGRFRALMRVPDGWTEVFKGFSIAGSEMPTKSFEFLYEKKGENNSSKMFHAVVEGKHPKGDEFYYRWLEGKSPREVDIPDLPEWMIFGLIRHMNAKQYRYQSSKDETLNGGEEKQSAMDLLSPGKQVKLLRQMQKFWPYRGGEQNTPFAGHYNRMSRLVLSLARGIDDWTIFRAWLEGGEWDKKSDWDGSHGNEPVNGGTLYDFAYSLLNSSTGGEEVAPWGTAWSMAVEGGWKPPKWAKPPSGIDHTELKVSVIKKVEAFKKAMEEIDNMDTPLERQAAYQNLGKSLDCSEKEMKILVQHLFEEQAPTPEGYWEDVIGNAKPIEVAIERLLAFNALTIVGSDGGVGKSVLIYRMAEAAANGSPFAGALKTTKGNVLIIQKDESDSNMWAKNQLMQLNVPKQSVAVKFKFNAGMFPELRQWIQEHNAKYVLMDSMVSLFGGGADLNETEIGTYMYLLNSLAAECGCAIVLTHHLRKSTRDKSGPRGDINMQDLYGSAFIGAGTSDIWGVIRDPNSEKDEPKFLLKVLKPRTGVTQGGDTFLLSGSTEDLSFQIESLNNGDQEGLKTMREGTMNLLRKLQARTDETAMSREELATACNMSGRQTRRLLSELLSIPALKIHRISTRQGSNAGRPSYVYWAEKN